MNLEINVYDEDGNVKKTCTAKTIDFEFGTIRAMMKLLNVDNTNDTGELLNVICDAWGQLVEILSKCFPDMEEEDWEHVKLKELVPVVVATLRYSFTEILTIPNDSKN